MMLIDIHLYRKEKITNSKIVSNILKEIIARMEPFDQDKEHLWVLGLTMNNKIKYIDHVSMGTLKQTLAEVREIYRMSIHQGAASIIVAHNHPSGNATPSESDIMLTERLAKAGIILQIAMVDHIIVCANSYYSFLDEGML